MGDRHNLSDPNEWLDRYGDYLFRYALLRVHHSHIAEDLLQETLLAALRSRRDFAGSSPEPYWLVGILKHKIMDYYRNARRDNLPNRDAGADENWDDAFDDSGHWKRDDTGPREWTMDPATILERKEFWEVLTQCLGELPERQARTFSLRAIEGLDGKEVCEKLNISEANFWVILYRVRMHLRRCLETKWQGRKE